MKVTRLEAYKDGWVVGDFDPTLIRSEEVEVAVKFCQAGDTEPLHYQRMATEVTVVASGTCRIGGTLLAAGDVVSIPPLEAADFLALTDCILVAVKSPSIPADKVLGSSPVGESGE